MLSENCMMVGFNVQLPLTCKWLHCSCCVAGMHSNKAWVYLHILTSCLHSSSYTFKYTISVPSHLSMPKSFVTLILFDSLTCHDIWLEFFIDNIMQNVFAKFVLIGCQQVFEIFISSLLAVSNSHVGTDLYGIL